MVAALVVATQFANHSSKPNPTKIQVDSVNEMLSGVRQNGIALGSPTAKLTLVEFADPQCPACGEFARSTFPSLVQDYVRTGKLRIEYKGLHFVDSFVKDGPRDSERQLRLAQAAGLQNKLWNVVELEYLNQGAENSGYATDALMRAIVEKVQGLDVEKALSASNTNTVVPMMTAAQKLAYQNFDRISTPSFLLGPTGAKPTQKITETLDTQSFVDAINAQLSK